MNEQELLRYSRHMLLPEVDYDGQQKLINSRVLVIGAGGLGSPVLMYLAASGIGQIAVSDFDEVEISNLQRQIVHTTDNIGLNKAESALVTLNQLNPRVEVEVLPSKLSGTVLEGEVDICDVVVDCSDNFETRHMLNRLAVKFKKPLVSGAAIRWEGQISVFAGHEADTPCYRCLYPEGDDSALKCSESGVISPLVGIIGCMQALETLKVLIGTGDTLKNRLQLFDAKTNNWRSVKVNKDPQCEVCG